ncbi:hypothetical protein XENOCAPTIV_018043, partial [Xenoophorus captivus]
MTPGTFSDRSFSPSCLSQRLQTPQQTGGELLKCWRDKQLKHPFPNFTKANGSAREATMEEESLCTSLPDVVEAELPQDSQTLADQSINGEQEDLVFGEEAEINQTEEENTASHKSVEVEQFEETLWSLQPFTCTRSSLSFATVGWDMPNSSALTASFMTDSSLANELYSEGVTSLSSTSFSHHHQPQDVTVVPFKQEDKEERDEVDTQPLNSAAESAGNDSKV